MQRPFTLNVVKGSIGLVGVNSFVGFVYNQNIPSQPFLGTDFYQLIVPSTKIDRTFQILQTNKLNAPLGVIGNFP